VPGGLGIPKATPTSVYRSMSELFASNDDSPDSSGLPGSTLHSPMLVFQDGTVQAVACLQVSLGAIGIPIGVHASLSTGRGHRIIGTVLAAVCWYYPVCFGAKCACIPIPDS